MSDEPQQQVRFQEDMALVPRESFAIFPMLFFGDKFLGMREGWAEEI